MKRTLCTIALLATIFALSFSPSNCSAMFSFGLQRDVAVLNQFYAPQCIFPPALNPCAVDCRPTLFMPIVPPHIHPACPAKPAPLPGFTYGHFPYPIFRF